MTASELAPPSTTAPPRPGGESRGKAWGFTGLLVLLYVINWGDKAIFGLVAQPLGEELGLSASQIGLVGSAFFLTFTVGGFFAGLLDKWLTLRWSLVVLALAWAASMLPLVVVASFAILLVSRMVLGLAEGPSGALVHAGVYTWHPPEKRGLPSACITAAASIAKILIAPALAVVVAIWGWRAAFLTLAVAGVAWCAVWLLTWRDGPYGERSRKAAAAPGEAETPRVPWSAIFRTPTFLGGTVAIFAMYSLVTVVLTWLPSYFEVGLGYSRVQAGVMFGFPSIAGLVFLFLSTSIGDRLLVRGASSRVLRGVVPSIGLLLCGLTLVTLPAIDVPLVAVVVVSVGYGIGTIVFPLFNAGLSEICPPKQIAGALGVFLGIMSVGGVIAPYLTGVIVDRAADPAAGYALAFQVFGIAAVVGGVVALLTVNPVRDARRVRGEQPAAG
ncbi:MFS transporter [Pseudonocardia nigra]|uniref:MFS transporter n=1 Tax=Pseudonocardia nigra TaxID=1921578 RepID=UPI001C5DBE60|nr:MFS transporter [Pseudonocardia nigra]